jgi:hypothetical protein
MRNGYKLVGFAILLVLIACFISKEGSATIIISISVSYYLELHNALVLYPG